MKSEMFLLFVYGTLQKDGCRNEAIKDQKFIRDVETTPEYKLLDLGRFPGLVQVEKDGQKIKGELWEIHKSRIPRLDSIEGAPRMYRMESVHLEGENRPVYAYFFKLQSERTPFYEGVRWDNSRG